MISKVSPPPSSWFEFCFSIQRRKLIILSIVVVLLSSYYIANIIATATTSMSSSTNTIPNVGMAQLLARPNILELLPYRCARDDYSDGILLDANENAYGAPIELDNNNGSTSQSSGETTNGSSKTNGGGGHGDGPLVLNRYPDPYQTPLKEKWSKYRGHGLVPANLFVGVGSDEAIDMLMRIFCIPGKDKILTTPPTYGMYKVCAKVNDITIKQVPLSEEFDVNVPGVLDAVKTDNTIKMVFLCSPGNPTCKTIPLSVVEEVAKNGLGGIVVDGSSSSSSSSSSYLVVVDEAYIDFATKDKTACSLVNKYPNIVVLQTMSKAFGLAAIRCGFCIGPTDIIQLMNNVKAPYNVNGLTSQMAIKAMENVNKVHDTIHMILEQRTIVMEALSKMDFVTQIFPSEANFILFRLKSNAKEVYKTMAEEFGVVTRFRGTEQHCNECIRVTVGTPDENNAFLEKIVETYKKIIAK